MQYRRVYLKGGTFFFTLVCFQRKPIFQHIENIVLLKRAIQKIKEKHPVNIDAIVVLPDHLHFIWTLPISDTDYSTRIRLIKSDFARLCADKYKSTATHSRKHKKEQTLWQRRFWEHQIRNDEDYRKHIEYIHFNPVKHGLVQAPKDWPYSSFHRYVKQKIYDVSWGDSVFLDKKIGHE